MAHPFFANLEREPDFLTLLESAFLYHNHRLRALGRWVSTSRIFDLRYFDQLFTAVPSLEAASSLSLVQYFQGMIGYTFSRLCKTCLRKSPIRQIFSLQILHLGWR